MDIDNVAELDGYETWLQQRNEGFASKSGYVESPPGNVDNEDIDRPAVCMKKITRSMKRHASLTLKITLDSFSGLSESTAQTILEWFLCKYKYFHKEVKVIRYIFEKDSKGKIHMHGLLEYPWQYVSWSDEYWKNRYKGFSEIPYLHTKIDIAKTPHAWMKYMSKNLGTKEYFYEGCRSRWSLSRADFDLALDSYRELIDEHLNEQRKKAHEQSMSLIFTPDQEKKFFLLEPVAKAVKEVRKKTVTGRSKPDAAKRKQGLKRSVKAAA